MLKTKINLVQGSLEWQAWREQGIGSSDVAAIFNKSPYKTKRDLFFEKQGLGEVDQDDKAWLFQKGHAVEKVLREYFKKQTGLEMLPACFEKNEIFKASLDGYNEKDGVFEAKFTGREVLKKASEGKIPEHHRIQIQHQLYTSDSDKAFWVGHDSKKTGVIVELGRDDKFIKLMVDESFKFYEALKKGIAPELSNKDTLFLTSPEERVIFERLKELKAKKDEIEARYKVLEEQVKSLAIHPKVFCEGVLITEIERAGSVNYKSIPELKKLAQDYIESFRGKSTVYKKITIKAGA